MSAPEHAGSRLRERRIRKFVQLIERFDLVSIVEIADWCASKPGSVRRDETDRQQARDDLARYESLMEKVKLGRHAYFADSTAARIAHGEMLAWIAFADGDSPAALKHMREAADLQDKVGQGEVDIPAREMLADVLLELGQPQAALVEYEGALKLSPNRFNGLFNAGMAAEAAGDKAKAGSYYAALLESTDNGSHSARPEFKHIKDFLASAALTAN